MASRLLSPRPWPANSESAPGVDTPEVETRRWIISDDPIQQGIEIGDWKASMDRPQWLDPKRMEASLTRDVEAAAQSLFDPFDTPGRVPG